MSNSKKQVYALYKGDDLIIMGEAKDCSLYTGLKESTYAGIVIQQLINVIKVERG